MIELRILWLVGFLATVVLAVATVVVVGAVTRWVQRLAHPASTGGTGATAPPRLAGDGTRPVAGRRAA